MGLYGARCLDVRSIHIRAAPGSELYVCVPNGSMDKRILALDKTKRRPYELRTNGEPWHRKKSTNAHRGPSSQFEPSYETVVGQKFSLFSLSLLSLPFSLPFSLSLSLSLFLSLFSLSCGRK